MIYKAQFETKRSRVDYDACDIRFSVGLSKEDFDHLRTNLLEESKYIKPYLHMLDRNADVDHAMLFTCDNEKYGLIVIPSDTGYARYMKSQEEKPTLSILLPVLVLKSLVGMVCLLIKEFRLVFLRFSVN